MSDHEDVVDGEPPAIDPYEVLGLERTATADQVKSAYRKAALKNHPDKVSESEKEKAHETFQSIAFAYAVLSDPARRKRYDTTGSTSESIVDSEGFDWSEYYREQYKDAISEDAIKKFAAKYKRSDEEKDDLLIAYEECEGDMDQVYERVMLSDVVEDDKRFRKIIDEAIETGDVPSFPVYKKENKRKRAARAKAAKAEEAEAEELAKELGVHDKIFGGKTKGKKGKGSSEDDLAALIQKRQQDRAGDFFSHLEEKYGAKSAAGKKGKGKGKKRAVDEDEDEDEPSEEAFQAAAARLKKAKTSAKDEKPASSTGRRSTRAHR
ncbi:Chaperone protein dnaJ 6 [Trichoderma simmonsii]|uniref:Chaperone protein dnaJ 6 n=1 Tax=Trichoderma simmonsii TaxID=1491479 RepID=A0A8G0L4I4_9HYPO|nr:Chaperone protein dnaJ 6 [Trichoderma simmonsii]